MLQVLFHCLLLLPFMPTPNPSNKCHIKNKEYLPIFVCFLAMAEAFLLHSLVLSNRLPFFLAGNMRVSRKLTIGIRWRFQNKKRHFKYLKYSVKILKGARPLEEVNKRLFYTVIIIALYSNIWVLTYLITYLILTSTFYVSGNPLLTKTNFAKSTKNIALNI